MTNKTKTKICNKCKKEQPINLFCKDKTKKDGLYTKCNICRKEYNETNKEQRKNKTKKKEILAEI